MKKTLRILVFVGLMANCLNASGAGLKTGQKAPGFVAVTSSQDTISLERYHQKKVLLAFFRYAGCPICNFRVHELASKYEMLKEMGYVVIAVFESENSVLQKYSDESSIPFPMIGDPHHALYRKYHVEKSFWKTLRSAFHKTLKKESQMGMDLYEGKTYKRDGSLSSIPADFIIDEKGIISIAYYGKSIGDHLPMNNILNK